MFETNSPFEESMNIFHSSIADMFRQFGLEFPDDNENVNNLNIFIGKFLYISTKSSHLFTLTRKN